MSKPGASDSAGAAASREAIARVLQAEREAALSIERSRAQAVQLAEDARADARRLAQRTEQRIRAVHGAFERELARKLAAIDDAALARSPEPGAGELAALERAVQALARELTGAQT
jgi:vacuolar-type H+-ATPase subunit H